MAEMLGTVVGVVSFGIQVCSGITKYLDGVKGRREDVASASRLCQSFELLLGELRGIEAEIAASISGNNEYVKQAMLSTNAELSLLRDFIDEVRTGDGPSQSFSEWVKDHTKRVVYPFRRSELDRLESQLSKANAALQAALHVAQTAMMIESKNALRKLEVQVSQTKADLGAEIRDVQQVSMRSHETMGLLSDDVSQVNLALGNFMPRAQQHMQHMETSVATILQSHSQLGAVLQALSSSDPRVMCQRMASKPDALRLACDAAFNEQALQTTSDTTVSRRSLYDRVDFDGGLIRCRCNPQRAQTRIRQDFGSLFYMKETRTERLHSSGCPLANCFPSDNRWTLGVKAKVFRNVLSTAITVTMSSPFGAGGFGISPSITVYPIHNRSPAARVTETLLNSAICLDDEQYSLVLERGVKTLQWIFQSGKASPLDMNRSGDSLLHIACRLNRFEGDHGDNLRKAARLLKFLVDVGVPRDRPNSLSALPYHYWIENFDSYKWYRFIPKHRIGPQLSQSVHTLWPDDLDIISDVSFRSRLSTRFHNLLVYQQVAQATPSMIEWYGNELQAAITRKDEAALLGILSHNTTIDFSERTTFGSTTLDLLIHWHRGLQLVLQHVGNSFLQFQDTGPLPALENCMNLSAEICSGDVFARCPESCICSRTAAMLLEADCLIDPCLSWITALEKASLRCREIVIQHLKQRRRRLADFAMVHLSPREIIDFGISYQTILDGQTQGVINALRKRNVEVPPCLCTGYQNVKSSYGPLEHSDSIYHRIVDPTSFRNGMQLVETLYSEGFIEIDTPNSQGNTPSINCVDRDLFLTFIKHGANPRFRAPAHVPGFTTTHLQFVALGVSEGDIAGIFFNLHEAIPGLAQDPSFTDSCRCYCSVNGCHPYTLMFNQLPLFFEIYTRYNSDMTAQKAKAHAISTLENHGDLPPGFVSIALRVATFEALSIRHTCCLPVAARRRKRKPLEEDEIRELWEEDKVRIGLLEVLLPEFEKVFAVMNCSLTHFFETYWEDKMAQALSELEGPDLTKEHAEELRQLGVCLETRDDGSTKDGGSKDECAKHDEYSDSSAVYWLQMLEDDVR